MLRVFADAEEGLSANLLSKPIAERWFEDYVPGAVYEFGETVVEEAEIVDFAGRFDPQPIHLDPQAAALGQFGGLIASGWHTAGMMMRMFLAYFLPPQASLASPGIDELRWTRPVRPNDVLRLRVHVLEARPSRSKPDRGLLRTLVEVLNQKNEVVMSLKPMNFVRRRPDQDKLPASPTAVPSAASGGGAACDRVARTETGKPGHAGGAGEGGPA